MANSSKMCSVCGDIETASRKNDIYRSIIHVKKLVTVSRYYNKVMLCRYYPLRAALLGPIRTGLGGRAGGDFARPHVILQSRETRKRPQARTLASSLHCNFTKQFLSPKSPLLSSAKQFRSLLKYTKGDIAAA